MNSPLEFYKRNLILCFFLFGVPTIFLKIFKFKEFPILNEFSNVFLVIFIAGVILSSLFFLIETVSEKVRRKSR